MFLSRRQFLKVSAGTVAAVAVEFAPPARLAVALVARHGPQTFRPSLRSARKQEG